MRARRRNIFGATMTEIAVFAVVAFVPMGILWNVMVTGSRNNAKMASRLETLEAMQMLWDLVRDDLKQACRPGGAAVKTGEKLEDGGSRELKILKFKGYGFDAKGGALYADPGETQWVRGEAVEYAFDDVTGKLTRNGRGIGALKLADVRFAIADGGVLKVQVRPEGDAEPLDFQVSLPGRGAQLAYAGWNPNWFDQRPQVEAR